ncbi:MAG: hypothetical protein HZC49_13325 [Nitrospirae bacterium]|nr:hypothetical protein [Nitrospirota bacterium]
MILAFSLLAGCIFISSNAIAAWTQAKGHSYNQLTLSYYSTAEKFTTIEKFEEEKVLQPSGSELTVHEEGDIRRTDAKPFRNKEESFTATKMSYYVEYGLLDELTFILSGGYEYVKSNDLRTQGNSCQLHKLTGDDVCTAGVGDIILGLRQKISNNVAGGPLSVQLDVKVPEAYEYDNPVINQNLGDGQYDALLKLKYGHGFSWGYAVLDAGYKYRFENTQLDPLTFKPADTVIVSISGGYNATPWLSIRGKIDWDKSVGNAEVSDDLVKFASDTIVTKPAGERGKNVVILDTLGLKKDSLTAGLALAFTVAKNMQLVASYDWALGHSCTDDGGFLNTGALKNTCFFFKNEDMGPLRASNSSIGSTVSLALAYSH